MSAQQMLIGHHKKGICIIELYMVEPALNFTDLVRVLAWKHLHANILLQSWRLHHLFYVGMKFFWLDDKLPWNIVKSDLMLMTLYG